MEKIEEHKTKIIRPHPGFQERFVRSNVDVVFGGGVLGGGKDQPLASRILTKNGWKTMGEMKVGEKILTPLNGETTVTGVFPQGAKEVYLIKTSDGRTCEAGAGHLWEVRTRKQLQTYREHKENKNFTILTTQEIMQGMQEGKKYYIPIPKAQEFLEKDYVIPPYVLGVMLGDGCLTHKSNPHKKTCFIISNPEQDIIDKVAHLTNTDRIYCHPSNSCKVFFSKNAYKYLSYLENTGLRDYSYNRFIPKEYLFGSIEQRRQLLYGLMDTDGSVDKEGRFEYSTTSRKLADDFVHLCRSLGYITDVCKDKRSHKYTTKEAFKIGVQTYDKIFSSKKHSDKWNEYISKDRKYFRTKDHVYITSIEYKGTEFTQCIMVEDKDHLYITDDFMTTHNSFAAILSTAEPSLDPNFRACFTRRTFGELKTGGGLVDDFRNCFKGYAEIKESEPPRIVFPRGGFVDMRQINDESIRKVTETWKGAQYDLIYMDELTSYEFSTFKYLMSRNRGKAKWTGKFRGTTNPERDCWVRTFIDWYVGPDGTINPKRDGVVRYFYMGDGETVDDIIWGDSKEEVYQKCRINIDRRLKNLGGNFKPENLIKSFTFYLGRMSENKSLLKNNMDYIGSVAAVGGKQGQQLVEGNWNVSSKVEDGLPISQAAAESVFMNDPRINNDKWITADLADSGTDNTVILAWNGLHIMDIIILCTSTPKENADKLKYMAEKHDIPDNHIIYDSVRALYINDYIPMAIPFASYHNSRGKYGRMYDTLKDVCYARLVSVITRRDISFAEWIAKSIYTHSNINVPITVKNEFMEECSVVKFRELPGGKQRLYNKKEMNKTLGKNRSMDLLDPCAMRMYPLLDYEYGTELIMTEVPDDDKKGRNVHGLVNIYNDSVWC